MSNQELQEEELEALDAIFDGDENYEKVSDSEINYKIKSEDGDTIKNFLINFKWGENYPEEKPDLSLDSFFNTHLTEPTKESILKALDEEAENNLGMSMTYALIEFAKENQGTIAAHQKERVIEEKEKIEIAKKKPKEKKEQLTKRQKARQGNRLVDGELPRGYDWVCLIRHLSQTGSAAD